ncbi:peptidase [Sneathiella sp. P13V-1]|uniref:imelysin family protein n=1 Tax=Sneathiella sp. P13V-1 TaxID=2697366 RepID=UPI001D115EA0|nr:imelysin family protein [Sneathiella sp. P13V-1]MBE7635978.1 peptidase [Sneathiella sp. P13V-1]
MLFGKRFVQAMGVTIAATSLLSSPLAAAEMVKEKAIVETYANVAEAIYEDSLISAKALKAAVNALVANPSQGSLDAARAAWVAARVPYQQSEAYRFGNAIVDDWEGRVNAWPLDEGLIDYVDQGYGSESDENALYTVNVIANSTLTVSGKKVDASKITPALLADTLHEAEDVEANVATGYHAIEFLLWGQDLNGTGAGAGNRPYTDFDVKNCTGGNCDRRAEYLVSATSLLITDLEEMLANWKAGGAARVGLMKNPSTALSVMLTGMGSLSYGELAGERMKLGLMLKDPEEEHDCFSDNTHNSHYFDQIGIRNVYSGRYKRLDGSVVSGPSLSDLVKSKSADLDREMTGKLNATVVSMAAMKSRAETIEAYDQMIGEGNVEGNAVVQAAIDDLVAQTRSIERVVSALGLEALEIEGSDSLDNPNAVFN